MKALKNLAAGTMAVFAAGAAAPAYTADAPKTDNPAPVAANAETPPKLFRVAAGQPKGHKVELEYNGIEQYRMDGIARRLSAAGCETSVSPTDFPENAIVIRIPARGIDTDFEADELGGAEAFARSECRPAPSGP